MPQRNHKQLFSAKRSSFIKIFFEIIFHKFIQKHISTLPIFKPSHPRSKVVGRYIVVYTPDSCRVIIVMEQIPEISRKIKLGFSSIFFCQICAILDYYSKFLDAYSEKSSGKKLPVTILSCKDSKLPHNISVMVGFLIAIFICISRKKCLSCCWKNIVIFLFSSKVLIIWSFLFSEYAICHDFSSQVVSGSCHLLLSI